MSQLHISFSFKILYLIIQIWILTFGHEPLIFTILGALSNLCTCMRCAFRPRCKRTQSTQFISISTARSRHFNCEVEECAWKPRKIKSLRKKLICCRLEKTGRLKTSPSGVVWWVKHKKHRQLLGNLPLFTSWDVDLLGMVMCDSWIQKLSNSSNKLEAKKVTLNNLVSHPQCLY